jgi:serine/threonine protein phosphatase PrpC
MTGWSWARASVRGTSHAKEGSRKQDAYRCIIVDDIFVCAVADGAGTASLGGEGASLACRVTTEYVRRWINSENRVPEVSTLFDASQEAIKKIQEAASLRGKQLRDFATTLLLFVSDGKRSMLLHVGDGAAVSKLCEGDNWTVLSWPASGEYASTTYFLTDLPSPSYREVVLDTEISSVLIFTDGIERLALDFVEHRTFEPFAGAMIAPVEKENRFGCSQKLSKSLGNFLCSDSVNQRTDDDKTLVLVSRK